MGCKARRSCYDNKLQNFLGEWLGRQCKPWNWAKGKIQNSHTSFKIIILTLRDRPGWVTKSSK